MSGTITKLNLSKVQNGSSIAAVIRTVNYAFSSDPLIQWLRPNATPWAQQEKNVQLWQYRRIQSIMLHGMVLTSVTVDEMLKIEPPRQGRQKSLPVHEVKAQGTGTDSVSELVHGIDDAGAVVFLHPPKSRISWSLAKLWKAFELFLLNTLKPVYDTGSKESRVDQFLAVNKRWSETLRSRYSKERLWYLEVIAVHPSLQSRGVGRKAMMWVLEHIKDEPIYLECTRKDNVRFYESFGFKMVEQVDIEDEEQDLNYWIMVRPGREGLKRRE